MSDTEDLCICRKPATYRCSACKTVSYCSKECQRLDWKNHKNPCKVATSSDARVVQVGTASQLNELLRVGAQYTIYDQSMALGLNPSLISGASGAEFYLEEDEDGAEKFWRLEVQAREQWEAKALVHNRKSQRFWTTYLDPITTDNKWIDITLDAILNVRLPSNGNNMWQNQVNANILAGLFPHLHKFTPAQNTTLLDLFSSSVWRPGDMFRLETGTDILFAHGKPTQNLIDQLVGRCLSWTRPYSELDKLLVDVALPIQKHWPDIAGTCILDLALVMLSPGRPGPAGGRTIPGDKILQIARTSPAAEPGTKLLDVFESFGVKIRGEGTSVLPWLMMEFIGNDRNTKRLQRLLKDENEGRLARFGIDAKDYSLAEFFKSKCIRILDRRL
ncbi:MYND-type domain-containing protein [Mycena venus]|uniref:MYND-type domain-containing protein n=1 Tax=Mycena venus TaxID=2733690 RepID=A0A8H6XLT6_9AGAR|nr:MYND-type domain-containing protein [Mycena venus]